MSPLPTFLRASPRGGSVAPRAFGIALAAALMLSACAPPERARVTECLAPAAAGGGWDLTCRLLAEALRGMPEVTGVVRTVNLPGAGGGIGFAHAVGQRGDDPGLIVAASPATTLRLAQRQYGRLRADDVRWVGAVGAEFGIVAVAASAPWETLDQLMADWRARPDQVVVSGGSAVAGQDHVKILLLARAAEISPRQVRYVPFDGGGEAMTALLGGFVQVFSGEASEVESQLEAGAIRVLAVMAPERVEGLLASVPTAREAGYPVEWITWRGFYVPGQVPDSVYDRWTARLEAVTGSADWAVARERAGLRPWTRTGEDFEAFVHEQVRAFEELAREMGLVE